MDNAAIYLFPQILTPSICSSTLWHHF